MSPWIGMLLLYTGGMVFGLTWIRLCSLSVEMTSEWVLDNVAAIRAAI